MYEDPTCLNEIRIKKIQIRRSDELMMFNMKKINHYL